MPPVGNMSDINHCNREVIFLETTLLFILLWTFAFSGNDVTIWIAFNDAAAEGTFEWEFGGQGQKTMNLFLSSNQQALLSVCFL